MTSIRSQILDLKESAKEVIGISSKEKELKQEAPDKMKAAVYHGPHKITIEEHAAPSFHSTRGDLSHGVIIKVITAGICGSDLHPYNGRPQAPKGMIFGHENFGEVVQVGSQVMTVKDGDLVLAPFNISCGLCARCKNATFQACECKQVNPQQIGGIYGYPLAGDWDGGQAQFLLIPFADFNCFKVERNEIVGKLASIAMMTDVLPTALHAVTGANVDVGKIVYIAGAGPIGSAAAHFSLLKGAAKVVVGDVNPQRLEKLRALGCETIDCGKIPISGLNAEIERLTGHQYADCAIDAVGFEATAQGHGHFSPNEPKSHPENDRTAAINGCIMTLSPGGNLSIAGVYLPGDPKEKQMGPLQLDLSTLFMKGLKVSSGQTPCALYLTHLYRSIICGRTNVNDFLKVRVIPLEEVPAAYEKFQSGQDVKYIVDPNGLYSKYNGGHPL